jgi:hypothetical protein
MTTSTSRPLAKNGQLPQHMTSRYIVMRQPKQEDALARGLSNLVYQPNFAHSRRPIFWEEHREGDLSPGFDFEYANALGDPLSHKKYAYLFNERKHAKWPVRMFRGPSSQSLDTNLMSIAPSSVRDTQIAI